MPRLEFREVAHLISQSRTTTIRMDPVDRDNDHWSLYEGTHEVHVSKMPFHVLFVHSRPSEASINQAARRFSGGPRVQVVFAPSIHPTTRRLIDELLRPMANGVWSTTEYLASYLRHELTRYTERLAQLSPAYYVDPHVDVPRRPFHFSRPNPMLSLLLDSPQFDTEPEGVVGVLLGEPGQGKTYVSHFLAHTLSKIPTGIPIYVDSKQWESIGKEKLLSVWMTIAHSFECFESPISWISGCEDEFLRTTLKAGLFKVVFDGLDEYVLWGRGQTNPHEVLDTLSDLARDTGARIVVTSRTAFWRSDVERSPEDPGLPDNVYVYELRPFDPNHAHNYFTKRFPEDAVRLRAADNVFRDLRERGGDLIGRGFVLSLVADLVIDDPQSAVAVTRDVPALLWLTKSLCTREQLRQRLLLDAAQQLDAIEEFAVETFVGEVPTTDLVELCVATAANLSAEDLIDTVAKLATHPLIRRKPNSDLWEIPQEQVRLMFVAQRIIDRSSVGPAGHSLGRLLHPAGSLATCLGDLASMLVDLLLAHGDGEPEKARVAAVISALKAATESVSRGVASRRYVGTLTTTLALAALERFAKLGSTRVARTETLLSLLPDRSLRALQFCGTLSSLDLTGAKFQDCRFDGVTWARCTFDKDTTFLNCVFVRGRTASCEGFGLGRFADCEFDPEAKAMLNAAMVTDGSRSYDAGDLETDYRSVLEKFVAKGGIGLKTVAIDHVGRGRIATSKHRDRVLAAIRKRLLGEHQISGGSQKGYHVRDEAKEAMLFYATNNVFIGPVRDCFQELVEVLGLA